MSEPVFLEFGARPEESVQLYRPGAPTEYSAEVAERLAADAAVLVARYPEPRSALLPLLHLVQSQDGYITPAGIEFCARTLELTAADVISVATFYSMYRRGPTGEYLVGVCTTTLCAVLGGDAILSALCEHLGIEPGGTTDDGRVTVERIECNAACDYAPVVMVNWEFFDDQTVASARALVDGLRTGTAPLPTRGAPLLPFRETARLLAGFDDARSGAVAASGVGGEPTLAGLRKAQT
ncbi:NADH-quinone oxidoreductase, E subunit OS=Tsukamurella paurometabola (strain ATCC 8368 / DSM/ CCUG 35730 / CIP 100753 / JCM 10117 / KCTC 9821 / NBRC 16120/ NCIMB 702349 / NCTC 13040) OX=521096 GN=Tpau_3172 PE=3 SV=1 [Tsukamurella paurometabola]|uniref:NADH-quinone oxidoreductase, E subunit n=1 Tax=Tsukamurella paurometabola (strain ATCC 8368 / DSM 20162 / CCUG 35730 / CIP 100753 / JCM 10117 / KCTC 9821 / NBRC 16120 / NCIMB 702349 / NCTC 13040) TaxID=521096 RepID=D5UVH7_TSUPD|nr:NADH-quinone oxidoreductase subunit NuoE [Tsukamurella paurometabola]ADG79759.1 NADH-quinone oxidoreductase, E subunit [Tsukamurella paurometabola DSM 20162]SUP37089.1 NADH-quinone oxidoreductase subunit E [Tsukamurella paurometabola]